MRRWMLGVPGVLALGSGVWKAVTSESGTAGSVLVLAGMLLIIAPFVIDRLERVSVSGSGFEFGLSRDVAQQGAPKMAAIIDRSELARLAEAYGVLREALPDPTYTNARTYVQDVLLRRAATISEREKFDAGEIRALFANGTPVMRVMVLGLMAGDPSLADAASLAEGIARSATRTEQYEALRLAHRFWDRFTRPEQAMLRSAAQGTPMSKDSRRHEMAAKILAFPVP
ncbi:hypothetical protein QEZ54_17350 [Catellatospora sp. KI3]|uniref:hypothetical protein n=1 Tax=Catellatospora sp. KI3 TaxID=3041620 RepID=UPI0024827C30|nr:hypothetical protein [Catellatospora sp. KI3]MDI1462744.1 hypothetical protein [Catellatospora sp. KI3]